MVREMKTAPSILACDFLHLQDEMIRAEQAGADWLHCDVMDGVYVPNISFGFDIIKKIHTVTNLPLDVHMMTSVPEKYLQELKDAGAFSVTLHNDVMETDKLVKTLDEIKSLGMKAAVSLKPKVPAEAVEALIPLCSMVLVMTVEPGFGGQKFMEDMLPKIDSIRNMAEKTNPMLDIQVDGGIGSATIGACAKAGANVFVVGTASFRAPDMKAALSEMKSIAEKAAE
ncbi:MAG: ribulose-phosphate 3-epimerase [Ruminococcaceae bacterium]|nr:ribulose-phosphate 3-epimerase [Oscillospiraceae bacterium]